jgi:hypothetical protein
MLLQWNSFECIQVARRLGRALSHGVGVCASYGLNFIVCQQLSMIMRRRPSPLDIPTDASDRFADAVIRLSPLAIGASDCGASRYRSLKRQNWAVAT